MVVAPPAESARSRHVEKFGHRPSLVLVGSASYAMYEEVLAFIPVLCELMRRLRLDNTMALGVSQGTTSVAAAFSPFNTFQLGISQRMAELSRSFLVRVPPGHVRAVQPNPTIGGSTT